MIIFRVNWSLLCFKSPTGIVSVLVFPQAGILTWSKLYALRVTLGWCPHVKTKINEWLLPEWSWSKLKAFQGSDFIVGTKQISFTRISSMGTTLGMNKFRRSLKMRERKCWIGWPPCLDSWHIYMIHQWRISFLFIIHSHPSFSSIGLTSYFEGSLREWASIHQSYTPTQKVKNQPMPEVFPILPRLAYSPTFSFVNGRMLERRNLRIL